MYRKSIKFPHSLMSNSEGYDFLGELCKFKLLQVDEITFDFDNTRWIDANLSSPLASIIFDLSKSKKTVLFENVNSRIKDVLDRNKFGVQFMGSSENKDYQATTIPCSQFTFNDKWSFQKFIDNNLLSRTGFPKISQGLKKRINTSILEIFINAHIHGHSSCIYICGQYYPSNKKLHLTISDMGLTIRKNVNDFLKSKINGAKAIEWAVQEGNTTRTGTIPGGLGLSLIRGFLEHNLGSLEIVSSDGFWSEKDKIIKSEIIKSRFLGTIVNIKFNLADNKSYILASEINQTEIW